MFSFLQIKIYRRKFIAYTIFTLFMGLILSILTSLVLLQQWLENAQNQAADAFSRVESMLQNDSDRIEAYLQRVYSNNGLVTDVRFFLANSAEGYLTARLQNSRYDQPLASFPEDVKAFLGNGQEDILQVSLHTEERGNVLRFASNGATSFLFNLPNTDDIFRETIQRGFVIRKQLLDEKQISRQLGEFRFLVSSDVLFKDVQNYRWIETGVVSTAGDVYLLNTGDGAKQELFRRVASNERSKGFMQLGKLDRVFYVTHSSNAYDYQMVSIVDMSVLIQQKSGMLLIVFFIFLAAMVSFLLLIGYNLREDAGFLQRIIYSIQRVKSANFTPVSPTRYRKNEYGMIARELDDMTLQLNQHIRTEYLLKLKQQETEMKALQNQINPHFLYNTLEIIRSFALAGRAVDTAEAVATLGSLYREIVKNEDIILLGSELDLLGKYLKIMEFKYPDRFYYQINVDQALLSLPTVKFWMQPLAENFFVHGFHSDEEFNLLVVNGSEYADSYVLDIVDNGNSISEDRLADIRRNLSIVGDFAEESIGLRNVYTRLRFFYGESFTMQIENNVEAGVKITLTIVKEA
ncbi:histidine kinase [Paenibacillus sp. ACRRY]|uniref:sensor histidine kinase n=1 Tax=Paenibacillus sp. ACRRY TaxID=2918208 RepID=UPI001EF4C400|nr:histidine kinase [Paenibacillus sp. ACRRY]MCG7381657.1 histidine kinase [Paenibacillus sp. ACRRY]